MKALSIYQASRPNRFYKIKSYLKRIDNFIYKDYYYPLYVKNPQTKLVKQRFIWNKIKFKHLRNFDFWIRTCEVKLKINK